MVQNYPQDEISDRESLDTRSSFSWFPCLSYPDGESLGFFIYCKRDVAFDSTSSTTEIYFLKVISGLGKFYFKDSV